MANTRSASIIEVQFTIGSKNFEKAEPSAFENKIPLAVHQNFDELLFAANDKEFHKSYNDMLINIKLELNTSSIATLYKTFKVLKVSQLITI
jgi:putative IMPACT (imprinted ancient) family translation regulator